MTQNDPSLSDRLYALARAVEGTEADDRRQAHLTFRVKEELLNDLAAEVPIGQTDDPYAGTVQATVFLSDLDRLGEDD